MSVLGGKAASIAAVTGAGSGLRDRFPTIEKQMERIEQLQAQRDYFQRHKMREAMQELDEQIAEIRDLSMVARC